MVVRDVRERDAEAISQLITEFTQLPTTATQIQQRLARSRGIEHPILAEIDGHVVGFASVRLLNYLGEEAPYAEISELFVSAPYRRQGIAQALMTELEVRARAAGASGLVVLTAADNHPAKALYQAMGYEEFSIALQKWLLKIYTGKSASNRLTRRAAELGYAPRYFGFFRSGGLFPVMEAVK